MVMVMAVVRARPLYGIQKKSGSIGKAMVWVTEWLVLRRCCGVTEWLVLRRCCGNGRSCGAGLGLG